MVYYVVTNHRKEKVVEKMYIEASLAKAVAKRLIGKYKKSNKYRGDALLVIKRDTEANIWRQETVVERFFSA